MEGGANVEMASQRRHWAASKVEKDNQTPLMIAAEKGHLEVVRYLVAAGADMGKEAPSGTTAILLAALAGHPEVLRFLVEAGAPINGGAGSVSTPLGMAVMNSSEIKNSCGVVRALVEAGADPNMLIIKSSKPGSALKRYGLNPLHAAAGFADLETFRYLLDVVGDSPLMRTTLLFTAVLFDNPKVAEFLLEEGVSLCTPDPDGLTPLCLAAEKGRLAIVRCLIKAGADPSLAGSNGSTPLSLAARHGRVEVVEFLLENGARDRRLSVSPLTLS